MHEWLKQFHTELRVNATSPGYRREETAHVVRHLSEFGEEGFVLASNLTIDNARQVIRNELAVFDQPFEWKVYSYDQPENLREILMEEGFEEGEEEALMVAEASSIKEREYPEGLREITLEEDIEKVVLLLNEIWDEDHSELGQRLWRDKKKHPESLYLYGVFDGGYLVSAAWMYLEENSSFASLWGGATRPAYRKKGLYTALLAIRAQKAVEKGYRFLTVDALPMSRPILEHQGFQCLAYTYGLNSPRK